MGKDQASSSRAADSITRKTASQSLGFGGFSGSKALAPGSFAFGASAIASGAVKLPGASNIESPSDSSAAASSSVTLDGEITQHLKHLSKKESVTKIKALQSLREIIRSRQSSPDATATLPSFIYQSRRLFLDPSRVVRQEAVSLMGELIMASGRGSAPHLKALMGPWYQARHDQHPDVANAAKAAFQTCFPTPKKRLDALVFCKSELLDHLIVMAQSTREMMGDLKRESPEELEDRHERAVASSLDALASILDLLKTASITPDPLSSQLSVDAALSEAGKSLSEKALGYILKTLIKSKSKLIRSSTYSLLGAISSLRPEIFPPTATDGSVDSKAFDDACQSILGTFQEVEPSNHGPMWHLVLTFASAFPQSWGRCNFKKAVLPRLKSLLRHNCYGSSATSCPAFLPLFSLMAKSPDGLMGPMTEVPCALLESIWEGAVLEMNQAAHPAAATAYEECLSWCLMQSDKLSCSHEAIGSEAAISEYCHQLLSLSLTATIAPAALMLDADGGKIKGKTAAARRILSDCVSKIASSTSKASLLAACALEDAIKKSLSSAADVIIGQRLCHSDDRKVVSDSIRQLLSHISAGKMNEFPSDPQEPHGASAVFTRRLASFMATQLSAMHESFDSTLPLQLIADLVRTHGASIFNSDGSRDQNVSSISLESLMDAFCSVLLTHESQARMKVHADLIASLLSQQDMAIKWEAVLDQLMSISESGARAKGILVILDKALALVTDQASSGVKLAVGSWLGSTNLPTILRKVWMGLIPPLGLESNQLLAFLCGVNQPCVIFLLKEDLSQVLGALSQGLMAEGPASQIPYVQALGAIFTGGDSEMVHHLVRSCASTVSAIVSRIANISWNATPTLSQREEIKAKMISFGCSKGGSAEVDEEEMQHQETSVAQMAAEAWSNGRLLTLALKALDDSHVPLGVAEELVSSVTRGITSFVSSPMGIRTSVVAWKVASVYKAMHTDGSRHALLEAVFGAARKTGWACDLAANVYALIGSSMFSQGKFSWLIEDILIILSEEPQSDEGKVPSLVEPVFSSLVSSCLEGDKGGAREALLGALDKLTSPSLAQGLLYALEVLTSNQGCSQLISSYLSRSILPTYEISSTASLESLAELHSEVLRLISPIMRSSPSSSASISIASSFWMTSSKRFPMVSVEPSWLSLHVLEAALSCFPLPRPLPNGSPDVKPISDEEAEALTSLVRHQTQAMRHAALAASRRLQPDTLPDATLSIRAQSLVIDLETVASLYLLPNLPGSQQGLIDQGQYVRDALRVLEESATNIEDLAFSLSLAIRVAASSILSSTPSSSQNQSQELPSAVMSIQLLCRLKEKGILGGHPCLPLLTESCKVAMEVNGWEEAASSAVRLSRVILTQADPHDQIFDEIQEILLKLVILVGSVSRLSAIASASPQDENDESAGGWLALPPVLSFLHELSSASFGGLAGGSRPSPHSTRGSWVARACQSYGGIMQARDLGLDAADALLSLALCPHPLANVAYMCLLDPHSSLLSRICCPPLDANGDDSIYPEFDSWEGSEEMFLTSKCGVKGLLVSYLVQHFSLDDVLDEIEDAREELVQGGDSPLTPFLTAWSLVISQLHISFQSEAGTSMLSHAMRELSELPSNLLNTLAPLLPLVKYQPSGSPSNLIIPSSFPQEERSAESLDSIALELSSIGRPVIGTGRDEKSAAVLFSAVLRALPAGARSWFTGLRDKSFSTAVEGYTAARESPALIAYEIQQVQARSLGASSVGGGEGNFSVRASEGRSEVVAVLEVEDGAKLELSIFLPPCMPLKPAECEVRRKVGVSEAKLRKWLLSISVFMRSQNRSVADAIEVWKSNVDKEFEGVEPCLICYSVVSSHNNQLPKLQCRTCHVRFHPGCLLKWFKSSGKSVCVHCQSPW